MFCRGCQRDLKTWGDFRDASEGCKSGRGEICQRGEVAELEGDVMGRGNEEGK